MAKEDAVLFLKDLNIFFLNSGLVKARANILKKQLEKFGGEFTQKYSPTDTTHILAVPNITKNSFEKELNLKIQEIKCSILNVDWLSACLTESKLLPETMYKVGFKSEIKEEYPLNNQLEDVYIPKPVAAPPELYPHADSLPVLGAKRKLNGKDEEGDFPGNSKKYLYPQVVKGKNIAGLSNKLIFFIYENLTLVNKNVRQLPLSTGRERENTLLPI